MKERKTSISAVFKAPLLWTLLIAFGIVFLFWKPGSDQVEQTARENRVPEIPASTVLGAQVPEPMAPGAAPVANPVAARDNEPPAAGEVAEFREWADAYLAASREQRAEMIKEGQKLAVAHTRRIAEMIKVDPEQAIANAVPMVVRQDLPESIVKLLEERVNLRAALIVNGNAPLPGQENDPNFKPYTRVVSTEQGEHWNAYVYGKRGSQRTLSSTSINGISVGHDMAVADSPVRQLETGERPVPAGREVVESCPVSKKETVVARTETGALPPVSEETPAIETPERIIYVCSGGHITQVAEEYSSEEERAHWEPQGVTLNAGAGSGAPTAPTGSVPGSTTTGQRSLLYVRVTFPDHMIDPQSEAECHDALRQMADWVSTTSYGRLYYTYAVTPLIVLPYPESWYVQHQNDGASADSMLRGHAITLARAAGYDNLAYNNEVIRWNGSVGSYGGSAGVGGRNINLKTNSVGTLLHELGHNLGLWHANYWQTNPPSSIGPGSNGEYGNTFDLLGNSGSMGQFTASFKNTINWLPNETFWTVNTPGVYRLHQFDTAMQDPAYRYALRVTKDTERNYWAEFRQLHTTNTGFMNGLMLTWDRWGQGNIGGSGGSPGNGSNGGAQLLDMTPGSFGNGITDTRNDSALWVGRTFSDTDANIHITPISKNATTPPSMDVYVHTGDAPGNLAPTLSISASSTSVATNTAITLTATASDPNGDPIAYAWVFNDGTYSTNNSAVQTKSWSAAGHYQVLCTASDMKGKRTTRAILVTVGSPTTFTVSGNITGPDALPLEGVYVASHVPSNGTTHTNSSTFKGTWTDSDGNYTLTNLAAGSYTISPNLYPNVFTASGFSNPVAVGPSTSGKNFTSGSLPTITINVTDPIANEAASPGTGTVRLERSGSTASALSVQIFNTNTGTATRNTDYTLSPAPTASTAGGGSGTSEYIIPAGASFLDITVTPVNDSTSEGTEYASLDFANTSGGYILSGSAVARVEIVDDENSSLPVVKISNVDLVASESGADTATLLVERNGATTGNLTVNLTMTGTATNGTDYTIPSSVIIPAGSPSATFTLTPVDDSAQESTETAIVTIATNAAYARDTLSNSQTVVIHDNDLPVVTIAATDATLTETPGDHGVFTIARTGGDPYLPLTVDYAISGRAVHGADYRRLEGRAVIPAGASSTTVEIYPYDDTVDESTQDIILRLRSTTTYQIGGTGTATMSITDNDDSQIYVKLTQSGVIEPATGSTTAVSYQIIRPTSGSAITVNYAMSGTATNGVDYTTLSGSIAFAAGDTTKTINVSALADTAFEDTESVTLTILPGTGYTLMASQSPSATGYIVDGDQPTVDVSSANTVTSLTTDGSETTASLRFIISRDVATASELVVNYTMAGTATEGVDYTGTTGSVTIAANATSAYITITPVNDTIAEGVETIIMNITPATGTYGLRTASSTMLLGDNDAFSSGSVAFGSSTSSTTEAAGTHNVAVNVTGSPSGTISVSYRLSAGTAMGGGYDFSLSAGTLTFPQGTTSLNIPITIHPDILMEPAETIVLQLYNVSGGNLGTSTHTVTLNNQSMPEAFTDAATNLLASSVTLNGRVIPNGLATNVWFEYGPTSAYGSSTAPQAIGSGTTSVNVNAALSGFAPGGYHFRCVAQNSAGTTYGIRQIVSSSDANLSGLVTSVGTFTPAFDAATTSYAVSVPAGTSSVTVTPTVAQANATVKVNGSSVASGSPSTAITVGSGTTVINVVVTAQDGVTTKAYTLNVSPATSLTPQTISFGALPAKTYGDAPFALTATASSGLPVSYTSSNTAVATVSGSTVTIIGAGSTDITASQSGNATYAAAVPVVQSLVVNQAAQSITFAPLSTVLDDAAPFALTATASSGLAVTYTSSNTAVATVAGSTVTVLGQGETIITASQSGNTNYAAAAPVPQTLTVGAANPQAIVTDLPYTVLLGQSLSMNGSTSTPSFGQTISLYEWDLNNDDTFGDVTGATPAPISYAELTGTWGMVEGANTIKLKVTDTAAKTSTVSATVTLLSSLTWDANAATAGQTNGAGAWLGANQWWNGTSNQSWVAGSNAAFGGPSTAGGAVTLASPTTVNLVTFNTFTGTYTLGTAGQGLTINGGILKNSTSATVSIISPLYLGADQTWTNNSTSALTASSTLDNGGYTLTLGGTGTITTSGVISGAGGIVKNGTGRLSFGSSTNANTYTGPTVINGGILAIANNSASLGSGNLTLNGGVLGFYWSAGLTRTLGSGGNQVTIPGGESGFGGDGSSGPTINLGTTVVWGSSGEGSATGHFNPAKFVLGSATTTNAGSTTFSSAIDLNGTTRTIVVPKGLSAGGNVSTISAAIISSTGSAGLVKEGDGTLVLSAANTYTGNTTISGGVLRIGNNSAGTLNGGNYSANISTATNSTLQIWSSANQTLSGVISGGGGLSKAYGGTLTLSGANTYSGKTSLTPMSTAGFGTVIVTSFNRVSGGTASSSLGAPSTIANGTIDFGNTGIQGGGTLRYTGPGETTDRVINFLFNGTGATKTLDASGAGPLVFSSTFTGSGSVNNDITLTGTGEGVIAGGLPVTFRNLSKSGAGTWTLGGPVGNTGTTTISAGQLALSNDDVLSNTSAVTIGAATLDAAGHSDLLGTLDITAAAIINLGTGGALGFADSSLVDWTGGTLAITGDFVPGYSIRFGTSSAALTSTQLAKISVAGYGSLVLNANGYLTNDATPPAVADITDDRGGSSIYAGDPVVFTFTFNEDMDAASVEASDFGNEGTASGVIGGVAETSPGVFTVPVQPTGIGTLQIRINVGAVLLDTAGNALDTNSAILDDTVITVLAPNTPPVANSQNAATDEDNATPITLTGSDAEGALLSYEVVNLPTNGTLGGIAPNLTYTPAANFNGTDEFTFKVNDGTFDSNIATVSITVNSVNDAPVFSVDPIAGGNVNEDSAYVGTLAGSASDVDAGASLTFAKVSGPAWLTVAPNGALGGTPTNSNVGPNSFLVSVSDGIAAAVTATLNITVINTNDAPTWSANPIAGAEATEDAGYTATLAGSASDVDTGASLTFAKVSGPAWLTVAPNGALGGTPANSNVGSNSFTVSVSDGIAGAVTATLNITVVNTNDAPTWTANPIAGADATEDAAYTGTLAGSATDVDAGATLTFAKVSGPAWLTVAANGALGGTPANSDVGSSSFTVSVTDGVIASPVTATLNITVVNTNDAPTWTANPIAGADATEDAAYTGSLAGSANDEDAGASLTFAKVSGPAWLTVAPNGVLGGTPANSDVGSNSFSVSVTDGVVASPVTATLNITVTNTNDTPTWTLGTIIKPDAAEGVAYTGETLAGAATDDDAGDTLTYSKVSGPAWLSVAANGALSGTPASGAAGLNSFVVRVTDSSSATADATLEITVTGLPLPWVSSDIGTGNLAGSVTFGSGTFTQSGSGVVGGTSDKLRYTYQTLTGDGEIIARISNLQNTGNSSRVGVMIRDTLAPNSKQIFMGMTSSGAYRWARRTATGGSTSSTNSSSGTVPNTWVRLVRSGTTITAYKSTNGTTWTTVGSTTNTTFASTCYIGLAVGSGSDTTLNTSQFSSVTVTP